MRDDEEEEEHGNGIVGKDVGADSHHITGV